MSHVGPMNLAIRDMYKNQHLDSGNFMGVVYSNP